MLTVRGRHYLTGEISDFHLAGGRIDSIVPAVKGEFAVGGETTWVAPGLIDLQVNGYQGHDFCSGDTTPADVVAAAQKLTDAGVTSFCPTVGTNAFEVMRASLQAIAVACEKNALARERVIGIHLEGPYLSPEDGPRGAHPAEHVRQPDWQEFARFQEAAGGRIRLVTLAPELPGALDFIRRARQAGLVVALGHHAATREQIHAAVDAGAVLSTHLGNGAHSQLPRHPNYIWEQLAHDGLMASMIVDGCHLPPAVVKSFYRAKGLARLILISDAIWISGLPPGQFQLMGLNVELFEDGSVRLAGTPYLAGSTLKLSDAVRNVIEFAGAPFAEAVRMASENPARLLGLADDRGLLRTGSRGDLALFRATANGVRLACTIAGGQVCYQEPGAQTSD